MIKKIILTTLISCIPLQTFAFEDYIIMSDFNVKSINSSDENIASVNSLYNIENDKRIIILKAKNIGKTILTIETERGNTFLDIEITKNSTLIPEAEGFTYYTFDFPAPEKPKLRGE